MQMRHITTSHKLAVRPTNSGQLATYWTAEQQLSIYYATTNLGQMHSWQSGGVDFGNLGGKKD